MPKLTKLSAVAAPEQPEEDEIIGVRVMSLAEAPKPKSRLPPPPAPEEESKIEPAQTLPDPKKQKAKAKPLHKDDQAFETYIFRVQKEVCPEQGISKKAMLTMNQIISDKFDCIMKQCREITEQSKKGTITSKEVETAVKLLLRGQLCNNAVNEGRRAIQRYNAKNE